MVSRLTKLCPRMLVSSTVVFIFLSVTHTSADENREGTRCYWCGPLAEQVHRSQRAPSCNNFDLEQHQTVCDKGYTHCAIVATSPPYAESRLCVKFYQDECYSLYCNSTKTWRMVCACRGDLCNGPHTDRETKAFAILPKKGTGKTNSRNKRSLISGFISVKTKSPAENNTIIIINRNNDTTNILQSDQPMEQQNIISNVATMSRMPKNIEENIIIEHGTVRNVDNNVHASLNKVDNNLENMNSAPPKTTAMEDQHLENTNIDKQLNKNINSTSDIENKRVKIAKMDNMKNNQLEITKIDKPTTDIPEATLVDLVKETQGDVTLYTSMKPTSFEIEVAVVKSVTPGKLPPAEALQQNVTPSKAMELTTMGTVVMNTENSHIAETTTLTTMTEANNEKDQIKKNIGAKNAAYLTILLLSFLVHYCF